MKSLALIIIFVVVTSCNNSVNIASKENTRSIANKKVSIEKPSNDSLNQYYKLLQGTWQSNDDPKDLLIFDNKECIEIYKGKSDTDAMEFTLSYNSCDSSNKAEDIAENDGEWPIFLIKKDKTGDLYCYNAMTITQKQLTLMYLDHGNILSFSKK